MASYIKRGDSYRIKVTTKEKGCQYLNWRPDESIKNNSRKVNAELQRQMVLFEEKCKSGYQACNIKFADFVADDWIPHYAKQKYKPSTFDKMTCVIKRVDAEIGDMRLDSISRDVLKRMIQRFEEGKGKYSKKPLNPKTIRNTISYISTVFEYAKEIELLEINPCDNVKRPSAIATEKEFYSIQEANKLFDALQKNAPVMYRTFYILALYSGMRLGELCGLEWRDINFDNNTVFIKRSVYKVTKLKDEAVQKVNGADIHRVVTPPKTKSSIRCIKLPQLVFNHLNELKQFYDEQLHTYGTAWNTRDKEIVFRGTFGNAVSPPSMTLWLRHFCERYNLKHLCTHDFRHLNASLLIRYGCDIKTVQQNLGHAQASTTLDIYAYPFKETQTAISECISESIKVQ